jgi:hypothetical protein
MAMTDENAPNPQDLRRRAEQERREHDTQGNLPQQVEPDEAAPDGGPRKTPETLDAIRKDSAP